MFCSSHRYAFSATSVPNTSRYTHAAHDRALTCASAPTGSKHNAATRPIAPPTNHAAAAAMAGAGSLFAKGSGQRREYRDHRLEWMIRSGGLDIVIAGLTDDTIRFSWPN